MKYTHLRFRPRQSGATAVEFAIICALFLVLLISIMELSRVLFYMNSAAEATRFGARIAVVCGLNAAGVKSRMHDRLAMLNAGNINVVYNPGGCGPSTCQSVTVSIAGNQTLNTFIPRFGPALLPNGFSFPMPPFTTTLQRESLSSTNNDLCN